MNDTTAAPLGAHRTPTYAWVVLFMLAMIYIFNFLDRQLMSVLIESIKNDPAFRGGSVCLNRFRGLDKWISASVMLRPGLAAAG